MDMLTLYATDLKTSDVQALLIGAVAPRPIALVSTLSNRGVANLAPFSFFNAFGSDPPIVAFSPARRGRDGQLKDTYKNLIATRECVVHIVTYDMLEQMNLSSAEFPSDVSEFEKAGFTPVASQRVKPWRVQESPVHMECLLYEMVHLGDRPGSGNLAICQVLCFHLDPRILDASGRIDPYKVDQVARNGQNAYTRAIPQAMFDLAAPKGNLGLGFDVIPRQIRESSLLTGNLLARLACVSVLPHPQAPSTALPPTFSELETLLAEVLSKGDATTAWQLIISAQEKGLVSYEL